MQTSIQRPGISVGVKNISKTRPVLTLSTKAKQQRASVKTNAFQKVLIANRGEIAVRIIRACKEMGLQTVSVYSTADKNSLHVYLADEAVCIGEGPSSESYLSVPNLLAAATSRGAQAIHPGYGFLSERADFVEICNDHHLEFIGPKPLSIRLMGDKSTARDTMKKAGVPTVPGSPGLIQNDVEAIEVCKQIGFPVMIKATAGGGGRGMRLCHRQEDLLPLLKQAQNEAEAAFGNGSVYIERAVVNPRHIEFQVLADKFGNVIHLGERDCSIQRRNQKLLEEAPSPALTPEVRKAMGDAAVNAAKAIGYQGVGTIEFLWEKKGFYFMEMNTRIQVEHPVTEMVTGVDLIKEQIKVALGHKLTLKQEDIKIRGHSIECRINAEDPFKNFRPGPGRVTTYLPAGGPHVRMDSHLYTGYLVPTNYDSLLGKLIVWGENREEATTRMMRALDETVITGVPITAPFQKLILQTEAFKKGDVDTGFIAKHADELKEVPNVPKNIKFFQDQIKSTRKK
uniref:Biotin carboxylase n=1 Tax=Polytomella parva TaxID=51329 RepID=A0A7S0YER7_9CHLO|nr:acetyl-coenzyme a carboxylase carboxyl transferase subunit (ACCD) [Polytomella parva]|mmetsp:Transcript_26785/g.49205  ORF Transcript_26785/g.49205 Transcript_26785/m.49205 type:complete len:511 (+) Transcript_26785:68-1600(+)|eukprot:CAMPEP_0175050902 /NCGR_PEP_ID=MMETSP0052_2-20121109/7502_1 /TAXON_ID=51329 ORGANISM="Polytomella parva, Strain SAG 63-3" /NCGR_SAMPLE_ID=MMETSP0052_2 /ASSEMBLY_ACC=CAM_ASM_000194 /LENGTH=510 /DNA_ID=CAMNT_0016315127 /DNA_START=24 /DNA_END=1556 /DNA_ORIENTATION=+